MQAVVLTQDLEFYARVAGVLGQDGWKVSWQSGRGLVLADPAFWERGQVLLWRTPGGLRAYDPERLAFLTRRDDPKTLAEGLRGRLGLRLLPGEVGVLLALGLGVPPEAKALARGLGMPPHRARFHLKGLRNKLGLAWEEILRLARHQVQVAGLEDHPDPLARAKAQALLHVPGQEEGKGYRAQEAAPVGQALGV